MKFTKILKYIAIVPVILSVAQSCHYLDKREATDGLTLEEVFGNANNYELYVEWMVQNPMLRHLQSGGDPMGTWDDITDNSMSSTQIVVPCHRAAAGDYLAMVTDGRSIMCNMDAWNRMWKNIRISNMGLKYIDMYPGDEEGRNKIVGTCLFYRAFAYMELCRRWGGMPYLYEPFEDLAADLDRERDDMRTTYLKVADDFYEAAKYLKPTVPDQEWQHPTSVAAMALRSRVLLYAASPQATQEGGVQRDDLWNDAVKAAIEAINLAEDNGYAMVSGENYYDLFKGDNYQYYTKEILLGSRKSIAWGSEAYKKNTRPPGKLEGTFGVSANQKYVDCYDMVNGYPISDPKSGYNPQNPYINRGLRFEHDILYNQATAFGTKKMNLYHQEEGSSVMGGGDISYSNGIDPGYTRTGTYVIKWMGRVWKQALAQTWPYIRMAELYLNFAEAATEASWSIDDKKEGSRYSPLEALNKIRNRAGIAGLPEEYKTPERFMERVRNERRVELSFEDHRLFDIRRWLIGTAADQDNSIYGVNIVKLKKGYDKTQYPTGYRYEYSDEPVLFRIYDEKHNLFPINQQDTYIGPLFKQNPGWE